MCVHVAPNEHPLRFVQSGFSCRRFACEQGFVRERMRFKVRPVHEQSEVDAGGVDLAFFIRT